MTAPRFISRLRRFGRDTRGGVLVEFGVVITLFCVLFWVALDFGRFAYTRVLAQKATDLAARTAVVRAAACAGLPATNVRGPIGGLIPPRFGTSCSADTDVCATVDAVSCVSDANNATAQEIWTRIAPMLPPDASIDNLQFTYSFDQNLGFLGGPYTPMVTVEIDLPNFQFISPVAPLMRDADDPTTGATVGRGLFSVSLPAEDLSSGEAG